MTSQIPDGQYDWQAGDGLVCAYSSRSPEPCGPPVKTQLVTATMYGQKKRKVRRRSPLCAEHAALRIEGIPPFQQAKVRYWQKKIATERLISDHRDDFEAYMEEALTPARSRVLGDSDE